MAFNLLTALTQAQTIKLSDGSIWTAELHWYEAHGIGRKELKIKRLIEEL